MEGKSPRGPAGETPVLLRPLSSHIARRSTAIRTALDFPLCTMHITCMATKTISLKIEAYERLRRARRAPDESFSRVILRAQWPEQTLTGAELLKRCKEQGLGFSSDEIDRIERLKNEDRPPEEKWSTA